MSLKVSLGRWYLRVVDRNKPVPLSTVLLLRRFSAGTDALVPNTSTDDTRALRHSGLRQLLGPEEVGAWSMCVESINFLEQELKRFRPRAILEFGSGLSTLCLARFMHDLNGDTDRIYVCSVEQNLSVGAATLRRLAEVGLDRYVKIVNAPLLRKRIVEHEIECYDISDDDMKQIAELRPEFVLVDGPSAPGVARFGTVPMVREAIAPDAHVYLDDALRDCELQIAQSWLKLGMELDGVLPTKKGLLIGRLRPFPSLPQVGALSSKAPAGSTCV